MIEPPQSVFYPDPIGHVGHGLGGAFDICSKGVI